MEFYHRQCDHHLIACLGANVVATMVAKNLPDCDLANELLELLMEQFSILTTFIDGEHYGTKSLNDFMSHIEQIKNQIEEIENAAEKG